MYGLDGRRRMPEIILEELEGYGGARPVRIGNCAAKQTQLDVYGWLLHLAWTWHDHKHPIDPDYWDLLVSVVDMACERWREPDHGIWEVRSGPRHFVHFKVMCWVALDRGIALAEAGRLEAPLNHWRAVRDAMRQAIDLQGYDHKGGIYVQSFGDRHLDASVLLLPHFGYVDHTDPRMMRTAQWLGRHVDEGGLRRSDGLLMRYSNEDGLPSPEGAFLPCSFWMAECLARQSRMDLAREVYECSAACANELGLFSEEMALDGAMLGNFPQALTHVSQITAWLALHDAAASS